MPCRCSREKLVDDGSFWVQESHRPNRYVPVLQPHTGAEQWTGRTELTMTAAGTMSLHTLTAIDHVKGTVRFWEYQDK